MSETRLRPWSIPPLTRTQRLDYASRGEVFCQVSSFVDQTELSGTPFLAPSGFWIEVKDAWLQLFIMLQCQNELNNDTKLIDCLTKTLLIDQAGTSRPIFTLMPYEEEAASCL